MSEENYLKSVFSLSQKKDGYVTTNDVSSDMKISAASVTVMLKRLSGKKLINYKPYRGVQLSKKGKEVATYLIRKHRLWESFLVETLGFDWDQVHVIAEQLEHIRSPELTDKLDRFLDYPKFDPHGDPIPNKDGKFSHRPGVLLKDLKVDQKGVIVGVKDSNAKFLKYLDKVKLSLGTKVLVKDKFEFDKSLVL